MKFRNNGKSPGEGIITFGGVICVFTVFIFIVGSFNGVPNGLVLFGGGVLGLLTIAVGYLKRIAVAMSVPANTQKLSASTDLK
ncbi:hypothetical protein M707_22860 [Arthrobacter sp. AK-YN10]|nr:hypothetical protein M707_22860 [Arthrobacter sp. AK-YN10]